MPQRTQAAGFENYASDLTAIATQSNQLSQRLLRAGSSDPGNTASCSFEAQIAADRGTAEAL